MVEVFRTNVTDHAHAGMILSRIHQTFVLYHANFDLQDCDRILRVKTLAGPIHTTNLISLVNGFGFKAEVLPDDATAEGSRFADRFITQI
jgi:hypothetical protein